VAAILLIFLTVNWPQCE